MKRKSSPILPASELAQRAMNEYGSLIMKIVEWPEGLGLDAHLVGGYVIQYSSYGGKCEVYRPSAAQVFHRRVASVTGKLRKLLGR